MKIFKKTTRFSPLNKPAINEKCIFSPATQLTTNHFEEMESFDSFLDIHIGDACTVVETTEHLVNVKFSNEENSLLVSPEFLVSQELTASALNALEKFRQVLENRYE